MREEKGAHTQQNAYNTVPIVRRRNDEARAVSSYFGTAQLAPGHHSIVYSNILYVQRRQSHTHKQARAHTYIQTRTNTNTNAQRSALSVQEKW